MGEEQVEYDLGVKGPITGIVEDEDSVDFDIISCIIGRVISRRQRFIRERSRV